MGVLQDNLALSTELTIDNGQEREVVQNARLLGVTITNNLSWILHINETIKKTSKGLYLLRQLKRTRVSTSDLVRFYISCIRSVCDYAVPVFHSSLPNYLINDLEQVEIRALSIICPHLSYNESLAFLDMDSLFDHHSFLCSSLFSKILDDEEHKLHHLLPQDIPMVATGQEIVREKKILQGQEKSGNFTLSQGKFTSLKKVREK